MIELSESNMSGRPVIDIPVIGNKTVVEEFQNTVLRQVLKLRNDDLVEMFRNYIMEKDKQFFQMKDTLKEERIFLLLKTKVKLFDGLNAYILNELSAGELEFYKKHKKELNKRLKEMMGQRLVSNLSKLGPGLGT